MLNNYNEFSIDKKSVKSTLGRNPNEFEWDVLKHFYFSQFLNNPIPGINKIINHGENILWINNSTQLSVGLESKGSVTSFSAGSASTVIGTKPKLTYKSKQSKMSFGISHHSIPQLQSITGQESLFFLKNSKELVSACNNILQLGSVIIKQINPSSLGYSLNLLSNNKYGMDLHFSSAKQISILSDKSSHGVLIAANQKLSTKIKGICKKHNQSCLHLGNLKTVQFLSISIRNKRKVNLPLSNLNIAELPKISIVPAIPKTLKASKLKSFKELKNYSKHVLETCKIVNKQKWNSFKPKRDSVNTFSLIPKNNDFAVSFPDNMHFIKKDIKTGSRSAISNAARQLVCNGFKPVGVALIIHGGSMAENDNIWNVRELFIGVTEACQLMQIELFRPVITANNKHHPSLELCVIGKKYAKETNVSDSFVSENDFITMLGSHRGELNSSVYQNEIQKQESRLIPSVDLQMETLVQETVLQGIQTGLIKSAVNISHGGLVISLVKSLQKAEKGIGARIHLSRKFRQDEMLFGETQGMVVVSIGEKDLMEFERICMAIGVPSTTIGRVTNDNQFKFNDVVKIDRKKF